MQCFYCGKSLSQKINGNSWRHLFRIDDNKARTVMGALDKSDVPKVLQEKLKIRGHSLKKDALVMTMEKRKRWRVEADGGNIVVKRTGKERLDVFFWNREEARQEVRKLPALVVKDGNDEISSAVCRRCAGGGKGKEAGCLENERWDGNWNLNHGGENRAG